LWTQILIICIYAIIVKMKPGKVTSVIMVAVFMGEITLSGFMVTRNHYNGSSQAQFTDYTVAQKKAGRCCESG